MGLIALCTQQYTVCTRQCNVVAMLCSCGKDGRRINEKKSGYMTGCLVCFLCPAQMFTGITDIPNLTISRKLIKLQFRISKFPKNER